ncbi:hypothetical protein PVAP13_2NG646650 [Panicum virgatum]|uniref:Uncharacterized protein n=1 Tax=Panicum virgatum TaxID=38727 RepID=A0A8T0VZL7_PANVG|nr:hypothetical protein PVAP13_2NG646650 [Panicum virgatum]
MAALEQRRTEERGRHGRGGREGKPRVGVERERREERVTGWEGSGGRYRTDVAWGPRTRASSQRPAGEQRERDGRGLEEHGSAQARRCCPLHAPSAGGEGGWPPRGERGRKERWHAIGHRRRGRARRRPDLVAEREGRGRRRPDLAGRLGPAARAGRLHPATRSPASRGERRRPARPPRRCHALPPWPPPMPSRAGRFSHALLGRLAVASLACAPPPLRSASPAAAATPRRRVPPSARHRCHAPPARAPHRPHAHCRCHVPPARAPPRPPHTADARPHQLQRGAARSRADLRLGGGGVLQVEVAAAVGARRRPAAGYRKAGAGRRRARRCRGRIEPWRREARTAQSPPQNSDAPTAELEREVVHGAPEVAHDADASRAGGREPHLRTAASPKPPPHRHSL